MADIRHLHGSLSGLTEFSGDESVDRGCVAALNSLASFVSFLGVIVPVSGSISISLGSLALLSVDKGCIGSISGSLSGLASLSVTRRISGLWGTVLAITDASGQLELERRVSGVVDGNVSLGALTGEETSVVLDDMAVGFGIINKQLLKTIKNGNEYFAIVDAVAGKRIKIFRLTISVESNVRFTIKSHHTSMKEVFVRSDVAYVEGSEDRLWPILQSNLGEGVRLFQKSTSSLNSKVYAQYRVE